jgi:arylsulfatase
VAALARGGTGTLLVYGTQVTQDRMDQTVRVRFSLNETFDVGVDEGTPVTEDHTEPENRFMGKVQMVAVEAK